MEKVIVVNEKDEVIGIKKRDSLLQKDIYRVAALWVINKNNKVLLARRAYTKQKHPGLWGPAVAGTVEEGESYLSNIKKETREEIGLKDIKPKISIKERVKGKHNYFCQWFILELDKKPTQFDKSEVSDLKWFTKEEVKKLTKNKPWRVVDVLRKNLNRLFSS